MRRQFLAFILIGFLGLIISAGNSISTPTSQVQPNEKQTLAPVTETALPNATPKTSNPFHLNAAQSQEVTVFMEFVRAFNAGQLDAALALMDEQVGGSDCDFANVKIVMFRGKTEVAEWLRERFADHDQLQVGEILNENPSEPVGVIGVEWARRTSNTLARFGFTQGIQPHLGAKVVFSTNPIRISAFANSPYPNNSGCDPNVY
jgi:hypothetical protein